MAEPSNLVGPYQLLEQLGQGAMGIVYRARHVVSEVIVALKTVRVPAPRLVDSIRREVHALTRIRHPGVVRIADHGVHDGLPWYAMDLLEGESLRHFIRRVWSPYRRPTIPPVAPTDVVSETESLSEHWSTSVPQRIEPLSDSPPRSDGSIPAAAGKLVAILQIMRRACATLAYLHGEGLVNCDLKPENILLVQGQPIIIDFGLTAHHPGGSGRESLEALHAMTGTLPYMSPEQLRGEFVDARSDLYAIGCILYELVTGYAPFVGAAPAIRNGHLAHLPTPPSQVVAEVPEPLDQLILKLLEKDQADRYGFADEVAALLAELSSDSHRLHKYPPPRSYLYRPRFVGRDEVVKRLATIRDCAASGSGALVLLSGESGVGKTRVAMEVTRFAPSWRMHVVTSQSSAFAAESAAGIGPAPLHVVRQLLQAVADRCQEGGIETTERLLGDRRSVLAQYEPLLGQVPAPPGSMPPPMPLAVEASRQRLFKYLAETLASFAQEQPVLWVIDDLGWADELSLAFLQSLMPGYLEATSLFILGTYRSEEATEAVHVLAAQAHVQNVVLPRLGRDAVSSMIGDMLALREPKDGFVEFVTKQAEGNPFFVAEYLRTAVTERVLYRDQSHTWQLGEAANDSNDPPGAEHAYRRLERYELLPLPGTLRELIEQRLRKLSPAALKAGLAAAVLGREVEVQLVGRVASLSDEVAVGAVDELVRRQVFEQADDEGSVRFAHDKLREVAYARAPADQLVSMHAMAGAVLEERWQGRPDVSRHWATLGHHFAAARMREPAANYLKLAAGYARTRYSNGEAIQLYKEAIRQIAQAPLALSDHSASWRSTLLDLHEALGDVYSLAGTSDNARASYGKALETLQTAGTVTSARLYRKIGKTWEMQHRHDQALHHYSTAQQLLDADPHKDSHEKWDEWLQVQLDRLWVHYWLDEVVQMDGIVERLRLLVDRYASPQQRVRYFRGRLLLHLRKHRFAINEETLGFTHAALEACNAHSDLDERPLAQFHHGFALLFAHSFPQATAELTSALTLARRSGDNSLQARCLTYLALAARMQGNVEETADWTNRCDSIAIQGGLVEYVASGKANRAWLYLKAGQLELTLRYAREAFEMWQERIFPFHWMALLPRIEAALAFDLIEEAASCATALLAPNQQYLPGAVADTLRRASTHWAANQPEATRSMLQLSLTYLEPTGYR